MSSIVVSQPLDVIKTRIQGANFENKLGGLGVIADIMKNEGPSAFFKGLVPKILVVSPKLIASLCVLSRRASRLNVQRPRTDADPGVRAPARRLIEAPPALQLSAAESASVLR